MLTHECVAAAPHLLCMLSMLDQLGSPGVGWLSLQGSLPLPPPAVLPDTATVQHEQRNGVGM